MSGESKRPSSIKAHPVVLAVAVHEAGHSVAAAIKGVPFNRILNTLGAACKGFYGAWIPQYLKRLGSFVDVLIRERQRRVQDHLEIGSVSNHSKSNVRSHLNLGVSVLDELEKRLAIVGNPFRSK